MKDNRAAVALSTSYHDNPLSAIGITMPNIGATASCGFPSLAAIETTTDNRVTISLL